MGLEEQRASGLNKVGELFVPYAPFSVPGNHSALKWAEEDEVEILVRLYFRLRPY